MGILKHCLDSIIGKTAFFTFVRGHYVGPFFKDLFIHLFERESMSKGRDRGGEREKISSRFPAERGSPTQGSIP